MIKNLLPYIFILLLSSCGSRGELDGQASHVREVEFEFLDSMVVWSLSELYIADKDEKSGRLLFNDWHLTELLLTDLKGEVISQFKLAGEGPNQVMNPTEVAFWKDGLVVKEMSEEGKLNFFNGDYKKTGKSPALSKALYKLTIPNLYKSFSVLEKEGNTLIVGSDYNAVDEQLMTPEGQNSSFYSKAENGYIYVPSSEELFRLNIYPETWKPRLEQKWVGMASPFVQLVKEEEMVAVLPRYGNQIFYYKLNGSNLSPLADISLIHPERNDNVTFDATNDNGILYPFFTRLSGGGKYFLLEFYTEFPRELYESFRAKSEEFHMDPEFRKAMEKYRKAKYILTDTKGNQGAISELPIPGMIHFFDEDDILYIKPILETEVDHNVFYRYRVVLK